MHLDRVTLDSWTAERDQSGHERRFIVRLDEGDTMAKHYPGDDYRGPMLVELITLRDGGWIAHSLRHETPATIMLAIGTVA